MKRLNNMRLVSSFREISNALDIISGVIRIFVFVLVVLQGVLLVKESKDKVIND